MIVKFKKLSKNAARAAERYRHNVRPEDIKRMAEQWEDWK